MRARSGWTGNDYLGLVRSLKAECAGEVAGRKRGLMRARTGWTGNEYLV